MRQSGFTLLAIAVYDQAVGEYLPPFFARTVDEAVRQFSYLIDDVQSTFSKRPGDYRLFVAGEFHTDTGMLYSEKSGPVLIEQALDLVKDRVTSKVVPNPHAELEKAAFMKRIAKEA